MELKPLNRSFASQSENPIPNIKDYTKARKQPQKPLISHKFTQLYKLSLYKSHFFTKATHRCAHVKGMLLYLPTISPIKFK